MVRYTLETWTLALLLLALLDRWETQQITPPRKIPCPPPGSKRPAYPIFPCYLDCR